MFLQHKHDLIHKAVGWMLREIGKRDFPVAYVFLVKHYLKMPRTMLRYAIEKFEPELREKFMKGAFPVNCKKQNQGDQCSVLGKKLTFLKK